MATTKNDLRAQGPLGDREGQLMTASEHHPDRDASDEDGGGRHDQGKSAASPVDPSDPPVWYQPESGQPGPREPAEADPSRSVSEEL